MINTILDADRIEDGADFEAGSAPSKWNEGDAIVVRRDGSIVTQLVALDDRPVLMESVGLARFSYAA